ncbi:MAG TPA: alpha/beta hydrolase, partial [Turneriella sp.]|nr:alpha/beta hydrolase [Turneriella sp.]
KLAQVGHCNLFMGPAGVECIADLIEAEEAKDPKPVVRKDDKAAAAQAAAKTKPAKKSPTKTKKAAKPKARPAAKKKKRR